MEPKDSEYDFSTPKPNDSKYKGKEEELTPNIDSNKRKRSSWSNGTSSNESPLKSLDFPIGKSNKKSFSCKFCTKSFTSSQSLGGHQNAHKDERARAKAEKDMRLGRIGLGADNFFPYPNMEYFPYRPPFYPNPLVPRFAVPQGRPIFPPNFPRFIPPMPNGTSMVIPEENTEICAEYRIGEEIGAGCSSSGTMLNAESAWNGVVVKEKDNRDEDESLDLVLKL